MWLQLAGGLDPCLVLTVPGRAIVVPHLLIPHLTPRKMCAELPVSRKLHEKYAFQGFVKFHREKISIEIRAPKCLD